MSNSRIDEIIDRSQTNRKSKEQRDIGAIAWRERKQRLESAFAALHDSFPGNGARLARKGQTDGQVAGEYADCIIALGRQLERDKEILARPVYQLASNGDDAKAVAIEILKVGAIGNKRKVVGLLRKLTKVGDQVAEKVHDWLRYSLKDEIMGYRKLTTEVGGVSFMCLLTDELDAVGTVKDNLRGVEAAIKGRKSQGRDLTILDAGEAIKGLWSQIDELTKRGLGRRRPAAPKIIVNWSTAEQAVENVKVWLESLKNPVFSTTGRSPLPKKIGGKPRLETADPLKLQVYERIRKAHCPHTEYWEVVQRLKGDKDFMDQITEAGHQISAKCD